MFREALCYDDVLIIPQFSDIQSRKEVNIGNWLDEERNLWFSLPIISSPMDTVTEDQMAILIGEMGGLGIIHRYNTIQRQCEIVKIVSNEIVANQFGCAIGITGDYIERAEALYKEGVKILCLDVAHGDHILMKKALITLRERLGDGPHLMAGNVATFDGFNNLSSWGANSIRVGIGGGCFTPNTLVRTEFGDKPIRDIIVGDKVYTHTGNIKSVVNTMNFQREEEIVCINDIECTKNHEFYVIEKKHASLVTEQNIHSYAKWVHAERLDKEIHLLIELD
jgi:IMP dehydrogenase/GMP reductase